jgi:hypothetical protein
MNIFKSTTPVDMNAFFFVLLLCVSPKFVNMLNDTDLRIPGRQALQQWMWWLCFIVSGSALVRGVRGQLGCQRVACGQRGWR